MKRISILVILLLVFISGCSSGANTGDVPADISPSANVSLDDAKTQFDVPRILSFEAVQEYYELVAAAKLDKTQLQEFLNNKNYDMNGVRTKEDILQIESMVASVPFPVLEEAELTTFEINTDSNTMFVRYNLGSGEIVQFRTRLGDPLTDAELANAFRTSDSVPERLSAESMQSLYFMGSDTRTHATALNYAANAEGYLFAVEVFGISRENADNVVGSVIFDTLS